MHENSINKKNHETYLGDVNCNSGSNTKNVDKRRNSGTGAVSQVISTLNQVALGHNHFETALIFRDSMLVSKLVSSTEVWYNITKDQYEKLEEIDEIFLMKILELPESVPRLSLYVECGLIPIRYIIKTRRLMYYWQILHSDENELLYKFYLAQSLRPGRNDWVLQIVQDMSDIDLRMSEEEIKKTSKTKFKSIIQTKMNVCIKSYFQKIQAKQSKTSHLKITENFKPAKYLSSRKLNPSEIRTLFRLRSRTISVKDNHSSSYKANMSCRTCFLSTETQEHVFLCAEIRRKLPDMTYDEVNYQMIFGKLEDQEKFTKIYHLMLEARTDMMSSPSPSGGPVHQWQSCGATDMLLIDVSVRT